MASSITSFSSSSSTPSSSASASTATSSSSSSDDNNGGIPSKGANYFFGFLITFIVLLSFFICCGFGTRRSLARRRRALLTWGQWDSDSVINRENDSDLPTLFEPQFVKGDKDTFWLSIQPLTAQKTTVSSSSMNPYNHSTQPPVSPLPPLRRPSQNPHALHGLSLPTWIPAPPFNSSSSNNEPSNEKRTGKGILKSINTNDDATVVQVAVIVAMPFRPRSANAEEEGNQKILEIGVACEAWDSSARLRASEGSSL